MEEHHSICLHELKGIQLDMLESGTDGTSAPPPLKHRHLDIRFCDGRKLLSLLLLRAFSVRFGGQNRIFV